MYQAASPAPLACSAAVPGFCPVGGKTALGVITDSVYGGFGTALQSGLQLTRGWGFRGAFNHNWDPYWSTSLFGGIAGLSYNQTAKTLWCESYAGVVGGGGGVLPTGFLPGGTGVLPNGRPVNTAPPAGSTAGSVGISPDFSCDPGFTMAQIGLVTRWTPVKNLTFSGEVLYSYLHTNMHGSAVFTPNSAFPLIGPATYSYGDIGTASFNLRVQRNF